MMSQVDQEKEQDSVGKKDLSSKEEGQNEPKGDFASENPDAKGEPEELHSHSADGEEQNPEMGASLEDYTQLKEVYQQTLSKLEEMENLTQRQAAEFLNYKKRVAEERALLLKTAEESFLLDLLPVVDNFERALQATREASSDGEMQEHQKAMLEGLEQILSMIFHLFEKRNIVAIESVGKPFQSDIHEALSMQEGDFAETIVLGEVEKAYTLGGKLIRRAKVLVGTPYKKKESLKEETEAKEGSHPQESASIN